MLKTASEFTNSIDYLISGMSDMMNSGLKYQTSILNGDNFNETFEVIEERLNSFYEKTRVLEDVIAYTKAYVEQNVYDTISECKSILSSLEENRDKLKTNSFISYDVVLAEGNGQYTDRDNSSIYHSSISNNTIVLSVRGNVNIPLKAITRVNGFTPYKSSLDNLLNNTAYRVFYLLDGQISGGLKETLHIDFTSPSVINLINIITSNCEITNVKYINENGSIDYEDNFSSVKMRDKKTTAVEFTLTSKLYKAMKYYIDETRMASNFWDMVKENEYSAAIGIGTSDIADIDQLAGLTAFRTAYNDYLKRVEDWKKTKEFIELLNKNNGYSQTATNTNVNVLMLPAEMQSSVVLNQSPFTSNPYPAVVSSKFSSGGDS
jgi:hypothetical protein